MEQVRRLLSPPQPNGTWEDWEEAHDLPWYDDPASPLEGATKDLNRKLVARMYGTQTSDCAAVVVVRKKAN